MTIKLTREEAIQDLKAIKSFERYARGRLALDVAIEALEREPSEDGTLEVKVDDATKIGRVLISDDKHRGGLYYPDEDEPKGDLISRAEAIEAIEIVDWYHQNSNKDMVHGANDDEHQAWYKAQDIYKALEAVPSVNRPKDGDFISRADAIEALGEEPPVWCDEEYEIAERDQWRADIDAIQSVPSADRPRGEWIEETSWKYKKGGRNSDMKEILGTEWSTMIRQRCSECNKVTMVDGSILYKYCPHCGADMRGKK